MDLQRIAAGGNRRWRVVFVGGGRNEMRFQGRLEVHAGMENAARGVVFFDAPHYWMFAKACFASHI
jgi:hypothetical protein